jgi:tRNA dimethylallyltransferase
MDAATRSDEAPPILVLVGPTACGKTALLDELFGGSGPPGLPRAEVVSADSMQAYQGMDIGTAKPDAALLSRLPHHLIDILPPDRQYTAGDFVRLAEEAARDISARGRLPVLSGGTGFYVRNFILGLPPAPPADPEIRAALARELAASGPDPLRAELEAGDPLSAARIHPRDSYRLTRALEVLRATGRPLSSFELPRSLRPDWRFLLVELHRDRAELHARIDARVEEMFAAGLPEEVAALRAAGHGRKAPGMEAIGYREFFEAEELGLDRAGLKELVKRNSRRYAKRQETFFAGLPGLRRIELSGAAPGAPAALLESLLLAFLAPRG